MVDTSQSSRDLRLPAGCLAAVAMVVITVLIGRQLLMSMFGAQPLPHAAAQLAQLRRDNAITGVQPAGGRLVGRRSGGASQVHMIDSPPVASHVEASWRLTGSQGAALDSLIEPALHDGWTLTQVDCDQVDQMSTIRFYKPAGPKGFEEDLTLQTLRPDRLQIGPYDRLLTVEMTVPMDGTTQVPSGGWPAPSALWNTGVIRTDPGCLDHVPAFTLGGPAWPELDVPGAQLCALATKAWPEAVAPEADSDSCQLTLDGRNLSVSAAPLGSRNQYLANRLDLEGDSTRFALDPDGVWVALPTQALVVGEIGTGEPSSQRLTPAAELALAARLQVAYPG